MEAKQTPLIDLLEGVPRDTVLVVEHDQFSSSSHPVGRLCHEAAAELRRLHAESERDEALLRQALEALEELQYAVVDAASTEDVSLYYRVIAALSAALAGSWRSLVTM